MGYLLGDRGGWILKIEPVSHSSSSCMQMICLFHGRRTQPSPTSTSLCSNGELLKRVEVSMIPLPIALVQTHLRPNGLLWLRPGLDAVVFWEVFTRLRVKCRQPWHKIESKWRARSGRVSNFDTCGPRTTRKTLRSKAEMTGIMMKMMFIHSVGQTDTVRSS